MDTPQIKDVILITTRRRNGRYGSQMITTNPLIVSIVLFLKD